MDNKLKETILKVLNTATKKINETKTTVEIFDNVEQLLAVLLLCFKLTAEDHIVKKERLKS